MLGLVINPQMVSQNQNCRHDVQACRILDMFFIRMKLLIIKGGSFSSETLRDEMKCAFCVLWKLALGEGRQSGSRGGHARWYLGQS